MKVEVAWGALQHDLLCNGIAQLSNRVLLHDRALVAYVALRMIELRVRRNRRPPETMVFDLSPEACVALAEELVNTPELHGLRSHITNALDAHEDNDNEGTRAYRHRGRPVRETRDLYR